ncbi:MAG: energy-coupling factor ABC transporter ATP-binding protein [Bacilli bacterium]|nr:energy-coupling factor ABC transporter ATP-binding protein [Bacilli bacterium]
MNEVIVRELSFSYKNKKILNSINFDLEEGSFTTILGIGGSGKTTFALILAGLLPHKGYININRTVLDKSQIHQLRKIMGFVMNPTYSYFAGETVLNDLIYILENLGMAKQDISNRVEEIGTLFNLQKYYHLSPNELNDSKKSLLRVASAVIHNPKVLVLDDAFVYMDDIDKSTAFTALQKLNKEKKMAIIHFTNNVEDALYGTSIMVLHDTHILLKGSLSLFLQEEKKLTEIGLSLPFLADLSHRLSYYELLEKPIFDMKEMVDALWK